MFMGKQKKIRIRIQKLPNGIKIAVNIVIEREYGFLLFINQYALASSEAGLFIF